MWLKEGLGETVVAQAWELSLILEDSLTWANQHPRKPPGFECGEIQPFSLLLEAGEVGLGLGDL